MGTRDPGPDRVGGSRAGGRGPGRMRGRDPPRAAPFRLGLRVTLEKREERRVLGEEVLDLGDAGSGPVLDPGLRQVVLDAMEAELAHAAIIDAEPDGRHGPIGSTFGPHGPSAPRGTIEACPGLPQPCTS